MRRLVSVLACLVLLASIGSGGPRSSVVDPKMTAEEKEKALKLLLESQKELLDAVEQLSEEQWNFKPGPLRWSVGQVVEHIMLSESLLFNAVEQALAAKPNPEWETKTKGKLELLERVMPSRDRRAQAPEIIRPLSKLPRPEVMSRFKEVRAKTIKFVEQTNAPLKQHTYDHPFPVFSTLNAHQWLMYIPLHHIRHNKQIAEVKADPKFPK
jgi:uncharacterized damage-inducible protein DinB